MITTNVGWKAIVDGYPSTEDFGPYPTVLVALECKDQKQWGHRIQFAELRFFGGDKARPYWAGISKSDGPIENSSWYVTHWAPFPAGPAV